MSEKMQMATVLKNDAICISGHIILSSNKSMFVRFEPRLLSHDITCLVFVTQIMALILTLYQLQEELNEYIHSKKVHKV